MDTSQLDDREKMQARVAQIDAQDAELERSKDDLAAGEAELKAERAKIAQMQHGIRMEKRACQKVLELSDSDQAALLQVLQAKATGSTAKVGNIGASKSKG